MVYFSWVDLVCCLSIYLHTCMCVYIHTVTHTRAYMHTVQQLGLTRLYCHLMCINTVQNKEVKPTEIQKIS